MTFEEWSHYWTSALVSVLRQQDPQAFSGGIDVRAAYARDTADLHAPGTSLVFEHAVLVLLDRELGRVVLAAIPQWFGEMRQVHDDYSYAALRSEAQAQAEAAGVEFMQLPAATGEARTVYLRRLALPVDEFAAPGGANEFSPFALQQIESFTVGVASAANVFFAANDAGGVGHQQSRAPWVIAASLAGVVVLGLITGMIVGFLNGYTHEVVVQWAQEATYKDQPTGRFDIVEKTDYVCGGDEDYLSCVNAHVTLYNTVCAGVALTEYGDAVCEQLQGFIDMVRAEYESCGVGCLTAADADGTWGWPYLEQVEEIETVIDQPAQPELTRTERCAFDLGPIKIGSCPR